LIAMANGHEEKVDRDHRDDLPIWTVDIAHGKERVGDRDRRLEYSWTAIAKRCT
jgi:hypothetical protein